MPMVDGKKFPYTKKGKAMAKKAAKKLNVKLEVYPNAERQEESNRKYMTYDSIQTGSPAKAAPRQ